jgi:mRNA-degrading endonuclease RelE of RelBE toxin-antitoxin system
MAWSVILNNTTIKQILKLPEDIRIRLHFLVQEIRKIGPIRTNRQNFGKIRGAEACYHCHLKKGNPTYVAVWKVVDKENKKVEVKYAGTHEKADYNRIC